LIQLFKNGVVPMNERNIYHCDIKDSNVLADTTNGILNTRLIDWGLSTEYIPFKNEPFPKTWRNRPLQYNVPFSVIIFSDAFVHKYTEYIDAGGKTDKDSLKPFVINYLHFWIQERGSGHYKAINEIMYMLYSNDLTTLKEDDKKKVIESDFTLVYITDYIVDILVHFTRFREDKTLNLREYLDNVFINNVDVWGFCITYFPFLELFYHNTNKLGVSEREMFTNVKKMFVYLYTTSSQKMDKEYIIQNLENLNSLIKKTMEGQNLDNSLARGIKKRQISKFKNKYHHSNSKPDKTSKIRFKRIPKSKTRKFKKLFFISAKLKK
jgi:serine/threonine protein kinase